ncbi:hypothetical protein [Methylorubrum suomiense]|uniref:Two-component sensor histidine kinase n=1 Tax=Methylorubrum suomiense TaxID=144191 RepID=A0ABQ4UNA9_9HYPH|nr:MULTISPECIES: hypothetical protein [Methylobacteriaceae]GJE73693.1 hypothetical protein BGCPKDLD_0259 [Methylorubrum suomiense]
MIELRPRLASGEPPLVIGSVSRPLRDGSLRPLLRGLVFLAAIGLSALGPLAASIVSDARPDAGRHARLAELAR